MNASILIVSSDDFPSLITRQLEKTGYDCFTSRGVLKTRETLDNEQIDAIVWMFKENESALAGDLLAVFNLKINIPIIFITENYKQLDFAENIKGLFANHDLNDDLGEIMQTVETACSHSLVKEQAPKAESGAREIAFKNAVSHLFEGKETAKPGEPDGSTNRLGQIDLWEAVDRSEKQILAGVMDEKEKKTLFPRLKTLLKKD